MRNDGGFTLLELVLAITLAGVVALLVYGTAAVATDSQERMLEQDRRLRAAVAWRAVVEDALRNAQATATGGFVLENRVDAAGRPNDRLQFVTSGGTPPLTDDADWLVVMESRDGFVTMSWQPIGVVTTAGQEIRVVGSGFDVRVLGGSPNASWRTEWHEEGVLPRAVEIEYQWDGVVAPQRLLVNFAAGQLP